MEGGRWWRVKGEWWSVEGRRWRVEVGGWRVRNQGGGYDGGWRVGLRLEEG